MAVSKRLRYEILRRDNHACRYCGAAAPGARLTVDHVTPVALGGTDDPANLVAACTDCNAGKSAAAPDASLIAEVSADALRWAAAMRQAAELLAAEYRQRADLHARFEESWNSWTYGSAHNRQQFPLDHQWRQSVTAFLSAGLPLEVLFECADIACSKERIPPDKAFRYMCGIAWRKLAEMREMASALLAADEET